MKFMDIEDAFKELNKLQENLTILDDKKFFDLLNNTHIENNRFDIKQFEKLKGRCVWYCLIEDDKLLAASGIVKNVLNMNDLYINEIQSFQKGSGKRLLTEIINRYNNVWLMSEPGNDALINYYRQFSLKEYILSKNKSIYNIDTHFFTNISDLEKFKIEISKLYKKVWENK